MRLSYPLNRTSLVLFLLALGSDQILLEDVICCLGGHGYKLTPQPEGIDLYKGRGGPGGCRRTELIYSLLAGEVVTVHSSQMKIDIYW